MNKIKVKKISDKKIWLDEIKSKGLTHPEVIKLDIMPWGGSYKPVTMAAISYDDNGFNIYMRSYEKNIRFEGKERNDPVHLDSCMEFFISPVENNLAYFNFEINPLGTLYTGFCSTGLRKDSQKIENNLNKEYFDICAMSKKDAINYNENADKNSYWEISYSVPFEYIKKYMPDFKPKGKMRANFYKCGDMTITEHYVVWNNIEVPEPDYHRPEFFGELEL
ncbi:MAG: hypothetical protein E7388_00945 [Ruminococcaceae bacterium]|nr:hypothetical protein [Oscillospiraceae bacterium]